MHVIFLHCLWGNHKGKGSFEENALPLAFPFTNALIAPRVSVSKCLQHPQNYWADWQSCLSHKRGNKRALVGLKQPCQSSSCGKEKVKWTPIVIYASGRDFVSWLKPNSNLWSIMRERKRNHIPKMHNHIPRWIHRTNDTDCAASTENPIACNRHLIEKKKKENKLMKETHLSFVLFLFVFTLFLLHTNQLNLQVWNFSH